MTDFFLVLKDRHTQLFWFGLANFALFAILLVLSHLRPFEFVGTNGWYKPMKFALSIGILSWTVAWYMGYLKQGAVLDWCAWVIIGTLAFEIIYIVLQASRGEASHFNVTTPLHSAMYAAMAIAASLTTLAVGYMGMKFFGPLQVDLPRHYLWAIRLGCVLFVIFGFQGFAMGGRLAHGVGGPDGSPGLPFVNWSYTMGDLRIAHFIGMHALQVLPILAYYVLKDVRLVFVFAIAYSMLAFFILNHALRGRGISALFG